MLDVTNLIGFGAIRRSTGISFNMTAGDLFWFQGYGVEGLTEEGSPPEPTPQFGSISAQPIPGHDLYYLITGLGNGIAFIGDATVILAGLSVWVDGIEYPFDIDWNYDDVSDKTLADWTTSPPVFVDTVTYLIEIK